MADKGWKDDSWRCKWCGQEENWYSRDRCRNCKTRWNATSPNQPQRVQGYGDGGDKVSREALPKKHPRCAKKDHIKQLERKAANLRDELDDTSSEETVETTYDDKETIEQIAAITKEISMLMDVEDAEHLVLERRNRLAQLREVHGTTFRGWNRYNKSTVGWSD